MVVDDTGHQPRESAVHLVVVDGAAEAHSLLVDTAVRGPA